MLHIKTPSITNYLDDFLFLAISLLKCNAMVQIFLDIFKIVGCPISDEKTEWATLAQIIIFLGVLLNGKHLTISIPVDKKLKAMGLLKFALSNKKVMIKFIQQLTGTLNFLNRAIPSGRAFTKGMYDKLKTRDNKQGCPLKQHHHVSLNASFLQDCKMWLIFLDRIGHEQNTLCRLMIDFSPNGTNSQILSFTSDASRSKDLGMGVVFGDSWLIGKWSPQFIVQEEPSIEFLELYALVAAVITLTPTRNELKNRTHHHFL